MQSLGFQKWQFKLRKFGNTKNNLNNQFDLIITIWWASNTMMLKIVLLSHQILLIKSIWMYNWLSLVKGYLIKNYWLWVCHEKRCHNLMAAQLTNSRLVREHIFKKIISWFSIVYPICHFGISESEDTKRHKAISNRPYS